MIQATYNTPFIVSIKEVYKNKKRIKYILF